MQEPRAMNETMTGTEINNGASNWITTTGSEARAAGLSFSRRFSRAGVNPYDEVQWEKRTALITDAGGKAIFEQNDVEVPIDWSMTATNIVASKYLHGQTGAP